MAKKRRKISPDWGEKNIITFNVALAQNLFLTAIYIIVYTIRPCMQKVGDSIKIALPNPIFNGEQ